MIPRLKLVNVTKRYGSTVANDAISLEVMPGEILSVLGENGAGKSTLMKIIFGSVTPDEGEIYFDGRKVNISSPADARELGIAMVFQHFVLFETLTAKENILLGMPEGTDPKELEKEIGTRLFKRSNRGVSVTQEGMEFLSYARQVVEQYQLMESRYIEKKNIKKKFGVSMQHYTFAVNAFVEMVKQFGMDEYEFAVRETKTYEVIKDVKDFHSEIGILYLNEFNKKVLSKMLQESGLEFHPLLECGIYVYMWKGHPLADKEEISIEELEEYPCLSFEQGEYNSFYFAEEVLSTYEYKRLIKANDRATMLNLMVGLNGYTLCSGIICESLNGDDYCAVKLKSDEVMTIGYIKRKGVAISPLGEKYLEEIKKYKAMGDDSGYRDIL